MDIWTERDRVTLGRTFGDVRPLWAVGDGVTGTDATLVSWGGQRTQVKHLYSASLHSWRTLTSCLEEVEGEEGVASGLWGGASPSACCRSDKGQGQRSGRGRQDRSSDPSSPGTKDQRAAFKSRGRTHTQGDGQMFYSDD